MLRSAAAPVVALCLLGSLAFSAEPPARSQQNQANGIAVRVNGDAPTASANQLNGMAVPRLVKFTGHLPVRVPGGEPPTSGLRMVTFALYAQQEGGEPIWSETQIVNVDATGNYTAMLGSTALDGIPVEAFISGEPRWLGVTVEGEPQQPRMLLVSVPYALKAEEAEKLGGKAASEYVTRSDMQTVVQQSVTQALGAQTNSNKPQPGGLDDSKGSNNAVGRVQPTVAQQGLTGAGAASFSDTSGNEVVFVNQSGTGMGVNAASTGTVAVNGTVSSTTGTGLHGTASSTSGSAVGVRGDTAADSGQGVVGFASSQTGNAVGVAGVSSSVTGTGVQGQATGDSGVAVHGTATSPTGSGVGVMGEVLSPAGTAGLFNVSQPGATILKGELNGQQKFSVDSQGNIVASGGLTLSGPINAPGFAPTFTGSSTTPIITVTQSGTGAALVLNNTAGGELLSGQSNGQEVFRVDGSPTAQNTLSVISNTPGITNASVTNFPPAAITGHSTTNVNQAVGIIGAADGDQGIGIVGLNLGTTASQQNNGIGVLGITENPNGKAVQAQADATTGTAHALDAKVASPQGVNLSMQSAGGDLIQGQGIVNGQQQQVFRVDAAGTVTANSYIGDGSQLSGITASTLGGLPASSFAQLGQNNNFTGTNTFGNLTVNTISVAGDGAISSQPRLYFSAALGDAPGPQAFIVPDQPITVTRMTVSATAGSGNCSVPGIITLTDGTTTATLTGSNLGGLTYDSGPLSAVFPAGAMLTAKITQFPVCDVAALFPDSANLFVEYRMGGTPVIPPTASITGFNPTSGSVGTQVTINGSGLAGAQQVFFGSAPATQFTVVSASQINATVPAGATTGPIQVVINAGNVAFSSASFTVGASAAVPTITSFSPVSGSPGTSVVITGTNFTGVTLVQFDMFGGAQFANFTVDSPTQITATVPNPGQFINSQSSGTIQVFTAPQVFAVSPGTFTITPAAPVIGSINPTSGPVGTQVTITGTLQGISDVLFAGAAGPVFASFTPLSPTTVSAVVPEGAVTGTIQVDNPTGSAMSVAFTVTAGTPPPPPPVISEFDPASGSVGSTVFIGGNFPGTVTAVYFNGTAAPFSVCCNGQPSEITATVPPGATTGLITVQTTNGNAVSQTNFTVF